MSSNYLKTSSGERIYSIYSIKRNNETVYIGQTKRNPIARWADHLTGKVQVIDLAIKKHGKDSFNLEVLYQSTDENHIINEMENYFIELYDTRNNGYNLMRGGRVPSKFNRDTRQKIGNASAKEYILCNPDGEIVEIFNLSEFCREEGLTRQQVTKLISGKIETYRGWTLYDSGPVLQWN